MLLIGFMWIFVAMAAGILERFVVRGPWDATGPMAIMVAAVGAFFGSLFAAFAFSPLGDLSSPAVVPGVLFALLGGFGAFAGYIIDVRRRSARA